MSNGKQFLKNRRSRVISHAAEASVIIFVLFISITSLADAIKCTSGNCCSESDFQHSHYRDGYFWTCDGNREGADGIYICDAAFNKQSKTCKGQSCPVDQVSRCHLEGLGRNDICTCTAGNPEVKVEKATIKFEAPDVGDFDLVLRVKNIGPETSNQLPVDFIVNEQDYIRLFFVDGLITEGKLIHSIPGKGDVDFAFGPEKDRLTIHAKNVKFRKGLQNPLHFELTYGSPAPCTMLHFDAPKPGKGVIWQFDSAKNQQSRCTLYWTQSEQEYVVAGKSGTVSLKTTYKDSQPGYEPDPATLEWLRLDDTGKIMQSGPCMWAERNCNPNYRECNCKALYYAAASGKVRFALRIQDAGREVISPITEIPVITKEDADARETKKQAEEKARQEKQNAEWKRKQDLETFQITSEAATEFPEFDDQVKPVRKELRFFSDGNGTYIGMHWRGDLLFFGDGKKFRKFESSGYAGNAVAATISLTGSGKGEAHAKQQKKEFKYDATQASLTCGDTIVKMNEVSDPETKRLRGTAKFYDLPNYRRPETLSKIGETNEYLYTDLPAHYGPKRESRVFIGKAGNLIEKKVLHRGYYSDGGTTTYELEDASVLFPTAGFGGFPSIKYKGAGAPVRLISIEKEGSALAAVIGRERFNELIPIPAETPCDPFLPRKESSVQADVPAVRAHQRFDPTRDIPRQTLHVIRASDLTEVRRIEIDVDANHVIVPIGDSAYFKSVGKKDGPTYKWDGKRTEFVKVADSEIPKTPTFRRHSNGRAEAETIQTRVVDRDRSVQFVQKIGTQTLAIITVYPENKTGKIVEIKSKLIDYSTKSSILEIPELDPISASEFDDATEILYYASSVSVDKFLEFTKLVALSLKQKKLLGSIALKNVGHNWGADKDNVETLRNIRIKSIYLTGDGYLLVFAGTATVYM